MARMHMLVIAGIVGGCLLVACSSGGSKPTATSGAHGTAVPTGADTLSSLPPATVLAGGTVIVSGTPLAAAAAAPYLARATAVAQGTQVVPAGGASPAPAGGGTAPAGGSTPAPGRTAATEATGVAPPPAATAAPVAADDGFVLGVPDNPSGAFDVTVQLKGAPAYGAVNIQLTFDASLLSVTGVDSGAALGSQSFCVPPQFAAGTATIGCVTLGPTNSGGDGVVATFHFRAMSSGSSKLHFTTYADGGDSDGTYIIHRADADQQVVTLPLHDATVTVSP